MNDDEPQASAGSEADDDLLVRAMKVARPLPSPCLDEVELGRYLRAVLDAAARAEVEAHLAACAPCREALHALSEPTSKTAREGALHAMEREVDASRTIRASRLRKLVLAAVGASLAAAASLLFLFGPTDDITALPEYTVDGPLRMLSEVRSIELDGGPGGGPQLAADPSGRLQLRVRPLVHLDGEPPELGVFGESFDGKLVRLSPNAIVETNGTFTVDAPIVEIFGEQSGLRVLHVVLAARGAELSSLVGLSREAAGRELKARWWSFPIHYRPRRPQAPPPNR